MCYNNVDGVLTVGRNLSTEVKNLKMEYFVRNILPGFRNHILPPEKN